MTTNRTETSLWTITSKAGTPMGDWAGETAADALAAMHQEAGYECRAIDGEVVLENEDHRAVAGGVANWIIEQRA